MTNELEKQFFDTFGIESEEIRNKDCERCTYHEEAYDAPCYVCTASKCPYVVRKQPQITDRILLGLICLCPDLDNVFFTDVEKLKETLLNSYIKIHKYYTEVERLSDCGKELKHQVRTLFEEGK